MQSQSALLILSLAAVATTVTSQQVQTGLLYWCSFVEGGSSFGSYPTSPRTTWLGYNIGFYSGPCHLKYDNIITPQWTDAIPYVYSNGTAYTYTDITQKISPCSCLVRISPYFIRFIPLSMHGRSSDFGMYLKFLSVILLI